MNSRRCHVAPAADARSEVARGEVLRRHARGGAADAPGPAARAAPAGASRPAPLRPSVSAVRATPFVATPAAAGSSGSSPRARTRLACTDGDSPATGPASGIYYGVSRSTPAGAAVVDPSADPDVVSGAPPGTPRPGPAASGAFRAAVRARRTAPSHLTTRLATEPLLLDRPTGRGRENTVVRLRTGLLSTKPAGARGPAPREPRGPGGRFRRRRHGPGADTGRRGRKAHRYANRNTKPHTTRWARPSGVAPRPSRRGAPPSPSWRGRSRIALVRIRSPVPAG